MFTVYFVAKPILGAGMVILVIGATGKTGELRRLNVVALGSDVTVFDSSAAHGYKGDPLKKTVDDVFDYETVAHAMAGQQAVLVILGRSTAVIRAG